MYLYTPFVVSFHPFCLEVSGKEQRIEIAGIRHSTCFHSNADLVKGTNEQLKCAVLETLFHTFLARVLEKDIHRNSVATHEENGEASRNASITESDSTQSLSSPSTHPTMPLSSHRP